MPLSPGQILNNRYRIVKLLGQGGFGAVYRAWDIQMEGPCAVKENFDTSPAAKKQFAQEAKTLYKLRHPNLPRVFDHFIIPGQGQYLVMDFIEGEDLEKKVKQEGRLPEDKVLTWIGQVSDALLYLHSRQPPIIHRDIKPANIKITPEGDAILVDFGISKVFDPTISTTAGARAVSPGYSPPEQYGQGRTDAQSDVYALGATTYTLLTGQVPSASVDIVSGNSPPPGSIHKLRPDISEEVSSAVEKAMQLDKAERTQSVIDFRNSLQLRPSIIQQTVVVTGKPDKRKWIFGAVGAGILLLSVLFLVCRDHFSPLPVSTMASTTQAATMSPDPSVTVSPTQSTPEPTQTLPVPTKTFTRTLEDTPTSPVPTTTPVWISYLSVRKPTLGDIRDMKSIWETNVIDIGDIASPGIRSYESSAFVNTEYLLPFYWCAQEKEILEQNVENLDVKFYIDDQLLSENYIFIYLHDNNTGWNCNYWSTVFMGFWSRSEVNFEIRYTIQEQIFDGQNYFPPGDYTHHLQVVFE